MTIHDLDTPALLIDLDVMESNLSRVADYARLHRLRLRPHTKTHKIPELARRQLALGAVGLTVAKTTEAEVMLQAEPPNLLVAYPTIGPAKLARLVAAARQTEVTVALDSLETARPLSAAAVTHDVTFGVLAEMDAGLGRVGVTPGPDLVAFVRELARLPGLRWEGIAFYPGHIKHVDEAGRAQLHLVGEVLALAVDDLAAAGHTPAVVSGGSTPALFHSHEVACLNEIRPGTYIFNDRNTVASGGCTAADCAVTILTTVVSTAHPGQMILDGGSKTFSSDRLSGATTDTFGLLREAPEATFFKMNEEHGFVRLNDAAGRFRVGDRVRVVPNHVCTAMNMHEHVYGVRGEQVEETWPVAARGKLQ